MKRILTTVIHLIALVGLSTGCATRNGPALAREARLAYEAFIAQPRTFHSVSITGVTSLHLTGENMTLAMEAPLNPLQAMPQDADAMPRIADAIKNTVLGAVGIHAIGQVASRPATVVTQPAPLVVRPEVIQTAP